MPGRVTRRPLLAIVVLALAACAGDEPPTWTIAEAESIASVRGLPVNDQRCEGVGSSRGEGSARRFRRFDCVAGARNPTDTVDTVAVHYRLSVIDAYDGPSSAHKVERARFYGGPGIP